MRQPEVSVYIQLQERAWNKIRCSPSVVDPKLPDAAKCGTVSSTDWGQHWLWLCTKEDILYCTGFYATQCVGGNIQILSFDTVSLHFFSILDCLKRFSL